MFERKKMTTNYILHNRIGFKTTRLARIMEARLEIQLSEHNVTRLMWCIFRGVGIDNVNTPSGLSDYICIARPAISRLLKDMEKRGYIQRCCIDNDKRFTFVKLTETGVEKMNVCRVIVRELNDHFRKKLDKQSYEKFMDMIDILTEGEDIKLMRL